MRKLLQVLNISRWMERWSVSLMNQFDDVIAMAEGRREADRVDA